MTALSDYAKLEAEAVFHDSHTGTASEVIVSFGERSLVIVSLDDRPLAHWPLATLVSRTKDKANGVRIAPDRAAGDYITLKDAVMINAIEAVCPNLEEKAAVPSGSRRATRFWLIGILCTIVVGAYLSIPYVTREITADIAVEQEVRLGVLMRPLVVEKIGGGKDVWECIAPDGRRSLKALSRRLTGGETAPPKIRVIDSQITGVLTLPGGETMLFRNMLDRAASPEALAGVVAHQMAHHEMRAPLKHMVEQFSLIDLVMIWWGVDPQPDLIEAATTNFLESPHGLAVETAADSATLDTLGRSSLPSTPYANNLGSWEEEPRGNLSFARRHAGPQDRASTARSADKVIGNPFQPALDDRSWLALGNICDERQSIR